jgi:ATP-dependent Clp protease ATP-binding subunit ClpA
MSDTCLTSATICGCLQSDGQRMLREEVTEVDIADIVAKWTGIPVSKLVASERDKLLHLGDVLHRRVVGQDEAVDAIADAIQRYAPPAVGSRVKFLAERGPKV